MPGERDLREDLEAQEQAARLKDEVMRADPETIRLLLTDARSHNGWTGKQVSEATCRRLYDLMKWGPTSMNQQPARYIFVASNREKKRLGDCVFGGNADKVLAAPVTVIITYDLEFWKELPKVFPHDPKAADYYRGKDDVILDEAFRNGTLQGAYFMFAARALGLDCGPISGFNKEKVKAAFLDGTAQEVNFLCCLGYADTEKLFRRLPRLEFDEVARII